MTRVWLVLAMLAMGCGRIGFGVFADDDPTGDASIDGRDGRDDSLPIDFQDPISIGPVVFDPQLSADGLELWAGDAPFGSRLMTARRASTSEVFTSLSIAAAVSPTTADSDVAMTRDGLHLFFVSARSGTSLIWESSRSSTTMAFGSPVVALGLQTFVAESIEVIGDGTLYIAEQGMLYRTTRASPGLPFAAPVQIDFDGYARGMTITADELWMIYNEKNGNGLMWATRTTASDAFQERGSFVVQWPGCTTTNLADADINPDGRWMIVFCGELLQLAKS